MTGFLAGDPHSSHSKCKIWLPDTLMLGKMETIQQHHKILNISVGHVL